MTGVVSFGSLLFGAGIGLASEYSTSWGPEIGSTPPLLAAPDQTGTVRTLADLAGERGLLLFLNRSADW
jgi:hypothetical protein